MEPAFVLGVGIKGREVVRRLKEEMGGGRPYLVYCAVSTQEGEGAPLEPIIEDYLLAPVKAQITSEELGRYGPLANAEQVEATLKALLGAKESLQALFSQKAEALFSQERWVGAERAEEDIALYLVVDLADPLSLVALDLVRLAQKVSDYPIRPQAALLTLEESPFIYPVLQKVWEALQGPASLLSRGAFLIERENEQGERGTEEERLAATVEWLERAVNDRLPYHDDIEKPHLGSFGAAQVVVPKGSLNRFFTLHWRSEFLKKWTEGEQGAPMPKSLIEPRGLVENLVEKPEATATMPPNYATEVRGSIAPSFKSQQKLARLYPDGKLLDLNDYILKDVEIKIDAQEEYGPKIFVRGLQERSGEALERVKRRLNKQIERLFSRSAHPFAEGLMIVEPMIPLLKEKQQEAEEEVEHLERLESEGLFQEEPEQKTPSLPSILLRGLLAFWVSLIASLGLYVLGTGALFPLWRWIAGHPIPGAFLFLFSLVIFVFPGLRSSLPFHMAPIIAGLITVLAGAVTMIVLFPFLPAELHGLFLLTILFVIIIALAPLFWPKLRLYELMAIGPLRPTRMFQRYKEAEKKTAYAFKRTNHGLLLWRWAFLITISAIFVVLVNQWSGGNFWDIVERLGHLFALPLGLLRRGGGARIKPSPEVPLRWTWPPLVLTAVLAIKYIFDGFYNGSRRAQGHLLIPTRSYLYRWLFIALIACAGSIIWASHLDLSGREWLATLIALGAVALLAIARYAWEYINDQERLFSLVREWVEWHDGIAFLRFHLEAWRRSGSLYGALLEEAQTLDQHLRQWRESLQKAAEESGQLAKEVAQSLEKAKEQGFPHYVVIKPPLELYDDFLQEAGPDLEDSLVREHGMRLWEERPDEEAVKQMLSDFIEEKSQEFWKKRNIAQLLGPRPDISWMLEPAFPFWNCLNREALRKVYLGLPPTVDSEYYEKRISSKYGLIDPDTGRYMRPTLFEEDQWTITALYYRYGVSLDELGSLTKWKKVYEDERRTRGQRGNHP